ncbi:hypothetical protein G6F54_013334 [Rhizopus delemar]|nr:hypothetical protein G6F54_013334 [Rhizopus delemar]
MMTALALVSDETVSEVLSNKQDRPKTARHYDDMTEDMALDDYDHHRPASRSIYPRSLLLVWSQSLPLLWFPPVLMAPMVHPLLCHHHLLLYRSLSACGMPMGFKNPQPMIYSVTASRFPWSSSLKPGCSRPTGSVPLGPSSTCMALLWSTAIVALKVSLLWSLLPVRWLWYSFRFRTIGTSGHDG